jgi:hypothetical protein
MYLISHFKRQAAIREPQKVDSNYQEGNAPERLPRKSTWPRALACGYKTCPVRLCSWGNRLSGSHTTCCASVSCVRGILWCMHRDTDTQSGSSTFVRGSPAALCLAGNSQMITCSSRSSMGQRNTVSLFGIISNQTTFNTVRKPY